MKANLPPRRLIPRWRRTKSVLGMPEATFATGGLARELVLDSSMLEEAIVAWKASPTTGLLGDILSYSIDHSLRSRVIDLIRVDPAFKSVATHTQKNFISQLLDEEPIGAQAVDRGNHQALEICNPAIQREVATLRKILRVNPANPLALLDLAQFQLTSGNTSQAMRSVTSALSLNPNSRIALRTMARLYVHQRRFDDAHSLISRHLRTQSDPWLMATEIALADVAGLASKFAKKGAAFTRERRASNANLTELAGALGGMELAAGNMKRARELFRLALLEPNDNVVAQVITHEKFLGIGLTAPAQRRVVMSAHEAQTLLAWNSLEPNDAAIHAIAWHDEEPFSSRPIQFLTTIYAAQGNFESAEVLARRGLIADPKDPALLANLAYVLASAGKIAQAERVLLRLIALRQPKYGGVALATAGLMAMQQGAWDAGEELYGAAMRVFRERREPVLEAICCAYFARAALDSGHPERSSILLRAESLYKANPSSDAAIVLKSLKPNIEPAAKFDGARRLSQWVYDPKSETLIQVHGVTEPGAPALIVRG